MTNKKFKVAAMSMALTACVAAQPLIANAADDVNAVSNDANVNESHSEGESPASAPVAATSEGSSNTEVKAEKKQDMLAPDEHLGEYSEPKTDTDGNSTSEAPITKDAPEQEREPEIDGDGGDNDGTGNTDNTGNTDSGTGSEIKEQIPIGESTLTETPGQSSTVVTPNPGADPMPDPTKPPKVTTNPDGSVDIETSTVTPGTETTPTTASGEVNAESHPKEETSGENIDLDAELGKKKPDWSTQKDAKFNGYNVDNVEPSEDGNSKTLTLTKQEHLEGQMGSDELAKFTDSTKINHGDGTYDLVRTETYTDENGQQRTRTTTLHVKDNEVTVDTTITLIVALEKGAHDVGSEDISHVELPNQIKVTDEETGNTKNISAAELERLMGSTTPTIDGTKKTYTVTEGNLEYTIVVDDVVDEGNPHTLTNAEIFEKLDSSKYEYDKVTKKIYYIGNGEHAELTEAQKNTLRRTLSYTVTVKETKKSEEEMVSGKNEAEITVKTDALNNALINALKKLGLNDDQAGEALGNGKFNETDHTFTYTLDGKTYTLNYTDPTTIEDPSKVIDLPDTSGETDRKKHIVTGTAYVQNGTVVQGGNGTISNTINGVTFNSDGTVVVPDGAKATYDPVTNRLSGYTLGDTTYTFSYDTMSAEDAKAKYEYLANAPDGWTLSDFNADVTTVTWTATTRTMTELPGELSSGNGSATEETGGTYTVTIGTDTYTGLTYDDVTKTYTGKKDGSTVTIKVTDKTLDADKVRALLAEKYGDSITLTGVSDGTYTATYTNAAGTHTITYRAVTKDYQLQTVSSSTTI